MSNIGAVMILLCFGAWVDGRSLSVIEMKNLLGLLILVVEPIVYEGFDYLDKPTCTVCLFKCLNVLCNFSHR